MSVGALLIAWVRGASLVRIEPVVPALASSAASLGLGVALAVLTIVGTRVVVARTIWARTLREDFRALLADAGPTDAALLALTSGVGGRAALPRRTDAVVGPHAQHARVRVAARRASAALRSVDALGRSDGWLFGTIFLATGHLEGAVLAHVVVNFVNLRFVLAFDGRLDAAEARPGEQALVSTRRVRRD